MLSYRCLCSEMRHLSPKVAACTATTQRIQSSEHGLFECRSGTGVGKPVCLLNKTAFAASVFESFASVHQKTGKSFLAVVCDLHFVFF